MPSFTDEVSIPKNINAGLKCASPDFLSTLLGKPRLNFTNECMPPTNKTFSAELEKGPFGKLGFKPAMASLRKVLSDIEKEYPSLYSSLGSAGILCCRYQRNSTKISTHSWGIAIDLTIDGKLDRPGNKKVHHGLTLLAPIFNRHGWYWGAAFRVEDAMHFEVSKGKLEEWKDKGLLGTKPRAVISESVPLTRHGVTILTLQRGDKGISVVQLQQSLVRAGMRIKTDGVFGPVTERAVQDYQRRNALVVDGVAGPQTWKVLGGLR